MVICLERGADLRMAQLMPLTLTVSCFRKIQIGFTFLVPAHPGSPGQRAVKRMCVCTFAEFDQFSSNKAQSLTAVVLIEGLSGWNDLVEHRLVGSQTGDCSQQPAIA